MSIVSRSLFGYGRYAALSPRGTARCTKPKGSQAQTAAKRALTTAALPAQAIKAQAYAKAVVAGIKNGKAAVKAISEPPAPVLKVIHDNSAQISGIESFTTRAFYHTPKNLDDLIQQAQSDPTGQCKLIKRACQRGDQNAGIYGTGSAADTIDYTRGRYVVEIASPDQICLDRFRGTFFLDVSSKKHLVRAFEVVNLAERQAFKKPPLAQKVKTFVHNGIVTFKQTLSK